MVLDILKNGVLVLISLLFPRDDELIVFGSGSGPFADNSKYMFLEVSQTNSKKSVWISDSKDVVEKLKEKGYNAEVEGSLRAKFYSLRAKHAIIDHYIEDLPSWYVIGARKINLWHGFPYKKLGQDTELAQKKLLDKLKKSLYLDDLFLVTSRKYEHLFSEESESPKIYAGYPRNDIFNFDIKEADIGSEKIEEKFVFYLPTFRDYSSFEAEADLESLDDALDEAELNIVLKPHPLTEIEQDFDNIELLDRNVDIYPLLKQSEALITDYSSVMFDYMHTGKPVIRYQFDKEQYERERGLNEEVKQLIPGKKVKTVKGLEEALETLDEIDTDYEEKIAEVFECRQEGLQVRSIMNQID